jgi:hypothetical protein
MAVEENPIAYCPVNDVGAYEFPFLIKKGAGIESDQLLLEIHLWHMTDEEKAVIGELIEINKAEDLIDAGYTTDDHGVYIIGEEEKWMGGPDFSV